MNAPLPASALEAVRAVQSVPSMSLCLRELAILGAAREFYHRDDIINRAFDVLDDREVEKRGLQDALSRLLDLGLLYRVDHQYSLTRRGVDAMRANRNRVSRVHNLVSFI